MKIYNIHFHSVLFISGIVWSSGKMYLLEKRNEDPMSQTKSQVERLKGWELRDETSPAEDPGAEERTVCLAAPAPGAAALRHHLLVCDGRTISATGPDICWRSIHLDTQTWPGHRFLRTLGHADLSAMLYTTSTLHKSFTLSYGTFIQMENSKIKLKAATTAFSDGLFLCLSLSK